MTKPIKRLTVTFLSSSEMMKSSKKSSKHLRIWLLSVTIPFSSSRSKKSNDVTVHGTTSQSIEAAFWPGKHLNNFIWKNR